MRVVFEWDLNWIWKEGAFMRRRAMHYGFGRDFEGGHIIIIRFGFEWDLSGISREVRYGFGRDFEGGHIIIRFGFEWDLSGISRKDIL